MIRRSVLFLLLALFSGLDPAYSQLRINVIGETDVVMSNPRVIDGSGSMMLDVLLFDNDVLDSLELTDRQQKEVKELVRSHAIDAYARETELRSKGLTTREIWEASQEKQLAFNGSATMILLPHQMKQLKLKGIKMHVSSLLPTEDVFTDKSLSKFLGLSDEEMKALREKAKEVGKKLKKEIQELQRKAVGEVVDVLPEKKKASIVEAFGAEVFESSFKFK